jgi:hypothetical protein
MTGDKLAATLKKGAQGRKIIKTKKQHHPLRSCCRSPRKFGRRWGPDKPERMQIYPHPAEFASGNSETTKCPQTGANYRFARTGDKTVVENGDTTVAFPARDGERTVGVVIEAESAGLAECDGGIKVAWLY